MSELGSVRGTITLNVTSLRNAATQVSRSFQQIRQSFSELAASTQADAARITEAFTQLSQAPARIAGAAAPLRQLDQQFNATASSAQQAATRIGASAGQFGTVGPQAQRAVPPIQQVDAALTRVGATASQVQALLASVGQRFQSLSSQLVGAGATLSASVTAPLALLAKSAISNAIDFQTGMNVLAASSEEAAARMDELRAQAIALGADVALPGTSAADAGEAMLELVKAGISVNDTLAASRAVLQLSAAAQVDNATAAQIASAALNTFGLSGDKAAVVVDQLAAGANASSANIIDFSYGITQAGFAFASMTNAGYSADQAVLDLNTSIAALSKNGLSGSDAATALKNAIIKLQAPTDAGAATLTRLGIATFDAQGQMLPFQTILANLERGLSGLSQQERNAALNTIFLSDGMKAIVPLLGIGSAGFAALQGEVSKSGAAAALSGAQMQGLGGALQGFQSTVETVGLAIAEPLLGPLESIVRGVTDLIGSILTVDPALRNAGVAFLAVVAVLGPLLLTVGALITAFSGILAPVIGVTVAVAALAAAFASGVAQLGLFGPVLEQLQRIGGLVGQALGELAGAAVSWGSGLVEAYADGIAAAVGAVVDALSAIGDAIAYYLTPGSPPPLLPNLDTWGTGAAEAWLEGWTQADLGALDELGSSVEDLIRSFGAAEGDTDQNILERVIGSQSAVQAAIDQLRTTGDVSEATFAAIREAAGSAGESAERVARAYIATLQASRQLKAAQDQQKTANADVVRAQVELQKALASGNPQLIAERRAALAAAVAKQREARERVAAAKTAEEAAKEQLAQQEALAAAQRRQNDLLAEQRRLQEQESKGGGGGGGGGGAAKTPKKTPEEIAAEKAAAAEEAYRDSIASTDELLERRRAELAGQTEGSAEYYQTLQEISRLERQQAREQKQVADEQKREQDAAARAQRAYQDQISTTAEKLAARRDELAGLTEGSVEYYDKLREIAQLEEQQRREAEQAAKAAKGGAGGGAGGGGVKVPDVGGGGLGDIADQANSIAENVGSAMRKVGDAINVPRQALTRLSSDAQGVMQKIAGAVELPRKAVGKLGADVRGAPASFAQMAANVVSSLLGIIPGLINTASRWSIALAQGIVQTLPGVLLAVGQVAGAVLDAIGGALPGIVEALAGWAAAFISWAIDAGPGLIASLASLAALLFTWIGQRIPLIVTQIARWGVAFLSWIGATGPRLQTSLGLIGQILFARLLQLGQNIAVAVAPYVTAFLSWVATALPQLLVQMGNLRAQLLTQILAALPGIITAVGQWALAFLGWVAQAAPGLFAALGSTTAQLIGVIGAALPGIIAALGGWIQAFVAWVFEAAPGLLAALGGAVGQMLDALGQALPGIVGSLATWGAAFIAWVIAALPGLFANLLNLFGQLMAWIIARAPGILATLGAWLLAFVAWVAPAAADLIIALGLMFGQLLGFIIDNTPGIISTIVQWAVAFYDWVLTEALPTLLANLLILITDITKFIDDQVATILDTAAGIGKAIVDGIKNGIKNGWDALLNFVKDQAKKLLKAAMDGINASSPSKDFQNIFGPAVTDGAAIGIEGGIQNVLASVQQMADVIKGVRIVPPGVNTQAFTATAAAIRAAAEAVPLANASQLAATTGRTATAASQASVGGTTIENVTISIPGASIANGVDARRMAGEIAKELKYQLQRTG